MSRLGLVLGGGGVTGASFQVATLMALELACDWEASDAAIMGAPARCSPRGIATWVREQVGEVGDGWPDIPPSSRPMTVGTGSCRIRLRGRA